MKPNRKFTSPTKGTLSVEEIIAEVSRFVNEEPNSYYSFIIGTDSQTHRSNGYAEIDYVTAVVIYRKGKGARYFWRKEKVKGMKALRDKIYKETLMSLEFAEEIVPMLRKEISPKKYDLEIHIDVGPLGPTRDMIKEVVGMVTGSGYVAKTKPESWGASSVADKHA